MNGIRFFVSVLLLLTVANISKADNAKSEEVDYASNIRQQETLTNGFFGFGDSLAESGIEMGLDVTHIYQQNVRGGISKHRRAGRYSGSYDLELLADLHKLPGFGSGSLFLHLEGGWPDTEGIDAPSVGSYFGVNADAIGNDAILVKQLYYEGPILGDNLVLMIGKIDFTGVFDASAYADDECTQFLNAALVDDPTIPFPDYSLGIALTYDLTDSWYIMGGIADAQADGRETGFRTTFSDEDYFFYALETGVTSELNSANGPMPGTYRMGLWYDPQPKANTDYADAGKSYRDDVGFYLSCDQMLVKENADAEDSQGLDVFFRYGYANSERNDIVDFWSVGFQYQGLVEGRDDDVLGVGFAQVFFSNKASATYTEEYENAIELYYSVQVTPWLNISPSVQYIGNPGGDKTVSDAVVLGVRAQMTF
jgi:porin